MQTIRWGILGTGAIAHAFAHGLGFARGAVLQAVASRDAANAKAFAASYGFKTAHADAAALLADPEVDVVYIATPNERHHADCLAAIAAGKAVLCEKPFALNAAESREVLAAAQAAQVFCMEAMWMLCAPAVIEAREAIEKGAIGAPVLLTAQLGFARVPSATSRLFNGAGGGALLDLGVYPLALAEALLGAPQTVSAQATIGATGVDETVSILLGYASGAQASISASLRSTLLNAASVQGEQGVLHLQNPLYFPERYQIAHVAPEPDAPRGAIRKAGLRKHPALGPALDLARSLRNSLRRTGVVRRPHGTGYTAEAEEVMRCLRAGFQQSDLVPHRHTLAVMQTVDRIRAAWVQP